MSSWRIGSGCRRRVVADLASYERLLLGSLLKLPGIKDIRSNFAIRTVKSAAPLPLDHLPE